MLTMKWGKLFPFQNGRFVKANKAGWVKPISERVVTYSVCILTWEVLSKKSVDEEAALIHSDLFIFIAIFTCIFIWVVLFLKGSFL